MKKAKQLIPKEIRGDLVSIGADIRTAINQSEQDLALIQTQRNATRELVKGKGVSSKAENDKSPKYSTHLIGPRIQQRSKELAKAFNEPDPQFSIFGLDMRTRNEKQEKVLGIALAAQQIEAFAQKGFYTAFRDNYVIVRVLPVQNEHGSDRATYSGSFFGPVWELINADNFFAAPNIDRPLIQCIMHGHQYDESDYVIRQKIAKGIYLSNDDAGAEYSPSASVKSSEANSKQQASRNSGSLAVNRMFDCLYRWVNPDNHQDMLLRVIMQFDTGRIFRVEPWGHGRSPYKILQIKDTVDRLFAETGVAQSLSDFQQANDVLFNEILYNTMRQSRSPIIYQGGVLGENFDGQADNQYIQAKDLDRITPLPVQNAVQQMAGALQIVMGLADQKSHTNGAQAGGRSQNETATAETIAFQGFQTAVAGDLLDFSEPLIECARDTLYWIAEYWELFQKHYEDMALDDITADDLRARSIITITGQNPAELPATQIQVLQTALQTIVQAAAIAPESGAIVLDVIKLIVQNLPFNGKEPLMLKIDQMIQTVNQRIAMAANPEALPEDQGMEGDPASSEAEGQSLISDEMIAQMLTQGGG
jgi:hypothetical protein